MLRTLAQTAVFVAILTATYFYLELSIPASPVESPIMIEIEKGMSFRQAVAVIEENGLIRDPNVLIALGRATGLHKKITPGRYSLKKNPNPWSIFKALHQGRIIPWEITVIEGDTLEEIKAKLIREDLIDGDEFDRLVRDEAFMKSRGIYAPSLEGYLFPDTYRIAKGLSTEEILSIMIKRLREKYDEQLVQRTREVGLDENSVLTLASIIEKEAVVDRERPLISAVYHNRLKRGMRLQADPTVVYGIKPMSDGITKEDINRVTPYNTYSFRGLPPGPIASPGIKSIRAALYPDDVRYLYFVSNQDGTHTFSLTHNQHIDAVHSKKRTLARKKQ